MIHDSIAAELCEADAKS